MKTLLNNVLVRDKQFADSAIATKSQRKNSILLHLTNTTDFPYSNNLNKFVPTGM